MMATWIFPAERLVMGMIQQEGPDEEVTRPTSWRPVVVATVV
jgi:hypothetical protein